jgi:hypothetical protein
MKSMLLENLRTAIKDFEEKSYYEFNNKAFHKRTSEDIPDDNANKPNSNILFLATMSKAIIDKPARDGRKKAQLEMLTEAIENGGIEAIDYKYLTNIANLIGVTINKSDPTTIIPLLKEIPDAFVWDFELNAYINTNLQTNGIPIICISKPLLSNIELICDVFSSCIIGPPNEDEIKDFIDRGKKIGRESIEEAKLLSMTATDAAQTQRAKDYFGKVMIDFVSLYENSYHWAYYIRPKPSDNQNIVMQIQEMVKFGAYSYVEIHELAHILAGHVQQRPSMETEIEADKIFLQILIQSATHERFKSFMLAGAYMVLMLHVGGEILHMPELKIEDTVSFQRLIKIIANLKDIEGNFTFFTNYMPEIEASLAVAIQTFWNREFLNWVVQEKHRLLLWNPHKSSNR